MSAMNRPDSSSDHEKYDRPVYGNADGDLDRAPTHVVGSARDIDEGIDPAQLKRIKRKIDGRLIPALAALYSISLIDRTNLGLAAVAGLIQELRLDSLTYSLAALMFFPPYIVLEIPANIGIRKFGAAVWLSTAAFAWGVVQIGMGFVKNGGALIATRAIVGALEAVLFPGAAYLLACWNVRSEVQTRMSLFYASSIFISGLSAIIAYGFTQMNGLGGLSGWRWIFVGEGILTVVIAVAAYVFIVDFPDSPKALGVLSEEERDIVKLRIQRDRADAIYDPLTAGKILRYFLDPLYWTFALMFCGTTLVSYALAYFAPLLLRGLGFTAANAQILAFPPYVVAFFYAVGCGYFSDRFAMRGPFVMANAALNIVGAAMLGYAPGVGPKFAAVFLTCMGANANVPLIVGWMHSSISGQSKRAFGSALVIAFGGVGGIIATIAFKTEEAAASYPTGIKTTLALNAMVFALALGTMLFWNIRNKQADKGDIVLQSVKGFRYML